MANDAVADEGVESVADADAVVIVTCAIPAGFDWETLARDVISRGHAACVQGPPSGAPTVASIYRWEGKIERAEEQLVVFKTTAARYSDLESAIIAAHPYTVPEILAVTAAKGLDAYLRFVGEACR